MARFCTRCGNPTDAADCFCDQCGAPLAGAARAAPPAASGRPRLPRLPALSKRQWLGVAGGSAAVLIALGAGLWFMTREVPLPENAELEALLPTLVDAEAARCLSNFDYARDPVYVNGYDSRTQSLLNMLVEAGIYQTPTQVTQQEGYFRREMLEYRHAAEAPRYIKGNKLCIADGLAIDHADFSERINDYKYPVIRARIAYQLKNPAPWSASGKAAKPGSPFIAMQKGNVSAVLRHDGEHWVAMSSAEQRELMIAMQKSARAKTRPDSSSGLFSFLKGNPGRPIFGKWSSSNPFFPITMEFTADGAFIGGESIGSNISYKEGEKGEILVSSDDDEALRLIPKSSDEIVMILQGQRIALQREH